MEYVNEISTEEVKKYCKEVDPNLKKHEIPKDFDVFLDGLHENMLFSVGVKVQFNTDVVNLIVQDFMVHMLDRDRFGTVRYKRYNAEKYPDIPYYKWFLKNLNYFVLEYWRSKKILQHKLNRNVYVDQGMYTSFLKKNGMSYPVLCFDSLESTVFMKEIHTFLEIYSKENHGSFETNAYMLYVFKLESYSNVDLAYLFDVNNRTIAIWIIKLRNLIMDFLNQNSCSDRYKVYEGNLIRM